MIANGFYLLSIVLFPFASSLVAEYLDTDYATPAVVIYCAFNLFQSTGYAVLVWSTFKPKLIIHDEHAQKQMKTKIHGPRLAIPLVLCDMVIAFWFPKIAFCIITLMWIGIISRLFWFHKKFS